MTNSQKAFEDWVHNRFEYVKENSQYFEDMKAAWSAAIEFAAKMCEKIEQETWAKYKEEGCNPHQEGKSDGAGVCANEIRKQGAE